MDKKKIAVAMSGGVDSSAALKLLIDEGHTPIGVTMLMHSRSDDPETAAMAAKSVADALGIPHHVLPVQDRFASCVMDDFVREYKNARTPNPCVICNKTVKFPLLAEFASANGCGLIATGHYAKVARIGDRYVIKKAADGNKDQSYMLWGLTQEILSRLVLPLGGYTKAEIRAIAADAHLPTAKSKDSQDICFIPDGDYVSFLSSCGAALAPGRYTDKGGNILGESKAQECYTIGQRKGLGIALGHHAYVISRDAATNTVVLGDECDLYKKTVTARDVNFIACDSLTAPERLTAKVRYGKTDAPCTVRQTDDGEVTAEFDDPIRAPAPGQSLVVYDGDTVVLGGIIK